MANKELLIAFGTRIRELRLAKGLSQEQLAEQTGFHRTYIGMVERGERNLSLSNVATFAEVFALSIPDLMNFGGEG